MDCCILFFMVIIFLFSSAEPSVYCVVFTGLYDNHVYRFIMLLLTQIGSENGSKCIVRSLDLFHVFNDIKFENLFFTNIDKFMEKLIIISSGCQEKKYLHNTC